MEIHLINSTGLKKVVSCSEWARLQREGKETGFYQDVDWHLNNGFITSQEVKKQLYGVINLIKSTNNVE